MADDRRLPRQGGRESEEGDGIGNSPPSARVAVRKNSHTEPQRSEKLHHKGREVHEGSQGSLSRANARNKFLLRGGFVFFVSLWRLFFLRGSVAPCENFFVMRRGRS